MPRLTNAALVHALVAVGVALCVMHEVSAAPTGMSRPESTRDHNLGTLGPTYPIKEQDFLEEIITILKEKEAKGELERIKKEAIARATESIKNPKVVEGVSTTMVARTRYWDPSIVVEQPIVDDKGKVLVPKGTRRNPLDYITWHKSLFFFDGRDAAQVAMARTAVAQLGQKVRPVMVAGPVIDLMRKMKTQLFFDQQGALVKRFGIKQVPAWVYQEDKRIRIDEVLAPRDVGANQ